MKKKTRIHALLQDFDFGDWSQGVKSNMISQWKKELKKGMKNNSGKLKKIKFGFSDRKYQPAKQSVSKTL